MSGKTKYIFAIGQKFDRLTVIRDRLDGFAFCQCKCGTRRAFRKIDLREGRTRSCGCWTIDRVQKHGMEGTIIYNTWCQMLGRCNNRNNKQFKNYGGRGIKVCERWRDFRNFYIDMGEKPEGFSLERNDNDGNYEPGNCRWATLTEQIRNRRVTLRAEYEGRMIAISELAEMFGISRKLLSARIARGIPVEKALSKGKFNRWDKS